MTNMSATNQEYVKELELRVMALEDAIRKMLKYLTPYSAERMVGTHKYARVAREAERLIGGSGL